MTQDEVKELFDYRDGALYWKIYGGQKKVGDRAGTLNSRGYRQIQVRGKSWREHRLVFLYFKGYLPDIVDHINGVFDDNRIENLREATHSENSRNRRVKHFNRTGVKNVSQRKRDGSYWVGIHKDGKCIYIGSFWDFEEAKQAAADAQKLHHGDFARHQ